MSNVVALKGPLAPKSERSSMQTMLLDVEMVNNWKLPPFQRPLRVNEKVKALSAKLSQDGGILPGVITLGKLPNRDTYYKVDGQHRLEAFLLSGLPECIADVRLCQFDSMGEMADEYVALNSALVRMRPDDILRGLESSTPALQRIKRECEFVGYDQIRRGNTSGPVVGMSVVVRGWAGSAAETPTNSHNGGTAMVVEQMDDESARLLVRFLRMAYDAWGRDQSSFRLWAALNLTLCMWLYRRLVLDRDRSGNRRYALLDDAMFKKCLMQVGADGNYADWLVGRLLSDRDRSPAFARLRTAFVKRIEDETGEKVRLIQPAWYASR